MSSKGKHWKLTEDQKDKHRKSALKQFKNGMPPETKKKISLKNKGCIAWNRGIECVKETKEKISKANRGKKRKPCTNETKRKIGLANSISLKGRKLSKETKLKISKACMGSKNHGWKGGITSKNQKIRDSEEYKNWRLKVFFRDNFTCKKCNIKDETAQAHHVYNFIIKELRFQTRNGITFCEKCHKLFHKIYGRKNNTIEQLVEFLNK